MWLIFLTSSIVPAKEIPPQEALEDVLETRNACLGAGEEIPEPTYQVDQ